MLTMTKPGAQIDLLTRAVAEKLKASLGQPVLVSNVPGGSHGSVMATELASSPADGYTLGVSATAAFTYSPHFVRTKYGLGDFQFLTLLGLNQSGIICLPDRPWKTLKEAFTWAKKEGKGLTYMFQGSDDRDAMKRIAEREGVKLSLMPSSGGPSVISAVMGGHADLGHTGAILFLSLIHIFLHHTPEDLQARVERYHRGGCQIAIHTNGDNAIEEAINAIEKAQTAYPRPDARHMLIHCQMASEEQDVYKRQEGKTLIPGFIESHAHVTDWAECEFLQFTCYHIKDIAELQDMIRENAKTKKAGEWVIGYGYNDSMVAEMRHLERADIDAACADHPVFVMHGSGHLAYVNSKALEICNIHADTPIPEGGQGEIRLGADGLPSGLLVGQAYNLALSVIPKYTVEEYKGCLLYTSC